jgi:hypothetical protein
MTAKFDAFAEALAALCRQHHVVLAPSRLTATIVVCDVVEGDAPVERLEDRTGADTSRVTPSNLPDSFLTALAAEQFPGYIGRALTQHLAEEIVYSHPGARIVAIGSGRFIRGWAVIEA